MTAHGGGHRAKIAKIDRQRVTTQPHLLEGALGAGLPGIRVHVPSRGPVVELGTVGVRCMVGRDVGAVATEVSADGMAPA